MIKVLKLVTGEDIIADIQELTDTILLSHPAQILVTSQGIALIEYPLTPVLRDKHIAVKKNHILAIFAPETALLNAYNEKYGSGIVVADALTTKNIRVK